MTVELKQRPSTRSADVEPSKSLLKVVVATVTTVVVSIAAAVALVVALDGPNEQPAQADPQQLIAAWEARYADEIAEAQLIAAWEARYSTVPQVTPEDRLIAAWTEGYANRVDIKPGTGESRQGG